MECLFLFSRKNPHPLRLIRLARGLTQAELAGKVGRTKAWVSLIERGLLIPKPCHQKRIAALLAIEPDLIFTNRGDRHVL